MPSDRVLYMKSYHMGLVQKIKAVVSLVNSPFGAILKGANGLHKGFDALKGIFLGKCQDVSNGSKM